MPKREWKDTTSYSQGGSREPKAWSTKLLDIRLTVVRNHRDYPGQWLMLVSPLSIEQVLEGVPVEAIETAQEVALQQLQQYLIRVANEADPHYTPPSGEQMEQFTGELYTTYRRGVRDGHFIPVWEDFSRTAEFYAEAKAWRNVARVAQMKCPHHPAPKLLVVDLYGDRETIRIIPDTPENDAIVQAFKAADKAYTSGPMTDDAPDFSDFLTERGVPLFDTRQIDIS